MAYSAPVFLILLFQLLRFSLPSAAAAHSCSKPEPLCPPFTSTPPFPFSSSPGCGHPSFQINCSSPHSIITINNLSFSLLHYDHNSSSLLLSPRPTESLSFRRNCTSHFPSIPNGSVDLSGSPFRVSDSSCSRLSVLRPCPEQNLPNCSHCPWDCRIIKNPAQLFGGCEASRHPAAEQGCHGDILGFLDKFLQLGIELEWDEDQDSYFSNCKTCKADNGVCGFNSSDPRKKFICFRLRSQVPAPWIRQHGPNRTAIFCIIFVFMCLLAVVSIASVVLRSKRKPSPAEEDPAALYLRRHRSASLLPPVFTYEELEISTNRFDPKRKIGDGGFGSVYLGQLYDGRIVAVKQLHRHQGGGAAIAFSTKSFCNEILILSSINHPNLVKLHGYCSDPRGLLLVYDYVPNGTLAEHLHGSKKIYRKGSLTWPVRVDMALQTAMALEYLHFSVIPPIVHRDITSSNIFVEKDMRIKVGDFGLSRLLVLPPDTNSTAASAAGSGCVWTGPQGTPGYLDPDYHRSFRLTEKSDVYSFGVVLLELITGLKAVDQRRDKRDVALADMAVAKIQMGLLHQVVDPLLAAEWSAGEDAAEGIAAVAELAFRCVAADKDDRPDAREVAAELRQHFIRLVQRRMDRQRREEEQFTQKNRTTKKSLEAEQSTLNRATSPQQTGGTLKSMKEKSGQDKDAQEGSSLKTAGPDGEITAGFLLKKSAKKDTWSRRWFVFNEKTGKLGYTKKQEERHFHGVITLEECNIEEVSDEEPSTKNSKDKKANGPDSGKTPSLVIKITSKVPYKTVLKAHSDVFLKAESVADKVEWLNKLGNVAHVSKGPGGPGVSMRQSLSDGSLDTMTRRPADPEEELRWMSQEVRGYVEAVLNSLAANVPKAVVLCQVEKSKEDMLNKLYSSVSAQSTARIEELLQEDQNVKRRRERYQKQSSLLSKLTRQLSIHDNRAAAASNVLDSANGSESSPRTSSPADDWRSAFDAAANGPSDSYNSSRHGSNGHSRRYVDSTQNGDASLSSKSGRRTPNRMPPAPPGSSYNKY